MKTPPQRAHPKCKDLGCRSYNHLVCPVECELLSQPEPGEEVVNGIPLAVLTFVPLLAIT